MTAEQTLLGLRLPSRDEELAAQLQQTFLLIQKDFGGDATAFFQAHLKARNEEEKREEAKKWSFIQDQLLKRQSTFH